MISKYRLKKGQDSIEIVDGPFAKRVFIRDRVYTEIPDNEAHRFEEVKPPMPVAKPKEKAPVPEATKKTKKE